MVDPLEGLDDAQRVVATTWGGPLCVLAGAGTGKTRALTHRIAHGVAQGKYQPDQVLALTFTTKAAAEMGQRLRGLGVRGVATRTFHSAALRQLQHFWPTVTGGRLPDILPSKAPIVAKTLDQLSISVDTLEDYRTQRARMNKGLPGGLSLEVVASIHERYEQVKDEQGRIDFEDVLLATLGMLESEPRVADRVRAQYGVFLVDEYQDVSPLQQKLLDVWLGNRDDLVVVGDASQTIYSFAGASSSYLLGFAERFPNGTVVKLERNYRSGEHIVNAANSVMIGRPGALTLESQAGSREPIHRHIARSDEAEARYVATSIKALLDAGTTPESIAVLIRFGAQSVEIESALRALGVGVRVQGSTPFFEEAHVKRAMMEIRGAAVAGVQGSLPDAVDDILFGLGLQGEAPDHQGAERNRHDDLAAIRSLAQAMPEGSTLGEFSELLADRASAGDAPDVGAVTITTVHSAKGREWPIVFVVGLAEGMFPISYATTDEAIEEERRLFYVALTRAKDSLYLSMAERGRSDQAVRTPSRFLQALGQAAS
ncbi:MAG: ATP-dependent helicase [Pontimonas sp.]